MFLEGKSWQFFASQGSQVPLSSWKKWSLRGWLIFLCWCCSYSLLQGNLLNSSEQVRSAGWWTPVHLRERWDILCQPKWGKNDRKESLQSNIQKAFVSPWAHLHCTIEGGDKCPCWQVGLQLGGHVCPDLEEILLSLPQFFSQTESLLQYFWYTWSKPGSETGEEPSSLACHPSYHEGPERRAVLHMWVMWGSPLFCITP